MPTIETYPAPGRSPLPEPQTIEVATKGVGLGAPTGLSPSSISKFEQCPLAYYMYAVARIDEPATEAAVRGTFVHKVLEALMLLPAANRSIEKARTIASKVRSEVAQDPEFQALGLTPASERAFMWSAWKSVCAYFRLEDPALVNVESVEQFRSAHINGVPVRGLTDRVDRDTDGRMVVTDYKTGRAPRQGFAGRRMFQNYFYAALIEAVTGERPKRVRLMYVNDTDPTVISARPRDDDIRDVRVKVHRVWSMVQDRLRSGLFEATPSRLCDWCPHQSYCPAFGGDLHDAPLQAITQVQGRLL